MTQEKYKEARDKLDVEKKELQSRIKRLEDYYIKTYPHKVGDVVIVTNISNRKEKVEILSLRIVKNTVYIYGFKGFNKDGTINNSKRYMASTHKDVETIQV